jgi:hypothetical protein
MIIQHYKNINLTQQGTAHKASGVVCQDKTVYIEQDGIYVMTLSDGAGSRDLAHFGAEIITQVAAEVLVDKFKMFIQQLERYNKSLIEIERDEQLVKEVLLEAILDELNKYAKANKLSSVKELAGTLLFFATDHQNRFISGHIGDGVVVASFYSLTSTYFTVISEPENGEESNITYFVTDDNVMEHFRLNYGTLKNLDGICLMSDGLGEVFYSEKTGVQNDLGQFFRGFQEQQPNEYFATVNKAFQNQLKNLSTDDLSINLLLLERTDLRTANPQYQTFLFKNIRSKEHVFQLSPYSYAIHPSIKAVKNDINSKEALQAVIRYE